MNHLLSSALLAVTLAGCAAGQVIQRSTVAVRHVVVAGPERIFGVTGAGAVVQVVQDEATPRTVLAAEPEGRPGLALCAARNELFVGGRARVRVLDATTSLPRRELEAVAPHENLDPVVVSPGGEHVLALGWDATRYALTLRLWEGTTGKLARSIEAVTPGANGGLTVSADGRLAALSTHTALLLVDLDEGGAGFAERVRARRPGQHGDQSERPIAFVAGGRKLAVSNARRLVLLEVPSLVSAHEVARNFLVGAEVTADGRHVVTLEGDGRVEAWDAETLTSRGAIETRRAGYLRPPWGPAVSPDGRWCVIAVPREWRAPHHLEDTDIVRVELTGS